MSLIKYPLKKVIAYETAKKHIVIHGSFSRTKHTPFQGDGRDTQIIDSWNAHGSKYGCPYLIGRSGDIYQTYDPLHWAYHLDLSGNKSGHYDKQSIGICLANELYLTKNGSRHYAFGIDKSYNYYEGEVYERKFRGYDYWSKLDDAQINSLVDLAMDTAKEFNIEPIYCRSQEFNPKIWDTATIFTHSVVNNKVFDIPLSEQVTAQFEQKGAKIL